VVRKDVSVSRRLITRAFLCQFVLGDLRKFAEQQGDIIQWDGTNREFIITHGVSGVAWSSYRNPSLKMSTTSICSTGKTSNLAVESLSEDVVAS
jgi:hypothetical protein